MSEAILLEEQYYLTHSWEDKGVHTFPKGICPKVNIIARLENELAYYDSSVHRFNHYTTRTPPGTYIRKQFEAIGVVRKRAVEEVERRQTSDEAPRWVAAGSAEKK